MKVAFYKSKKRLFNRLVAWWTNGPYSHVEIASHQNQDGLWFCGSSSIMDGGVRRKYIDLDSGHWDVIDIPADTLYVSAWFEQHTGEKYDLCGLFGFLGRRGIQDQDKWFCSEAVAASLGISDPWRYDPNTLYALLRDKIRS